MGIILSDYKKSVIDEITNSIQTGNSSYYFFASNPIKLTGPVSNVVNTDYQTEFTSDWLMLFGKKLANSNIVPVIRNIPWTANTVYTRYDNTQNISNSNFYVIVSPTIPGGAYNIYKCIDNNSGAPSLYAPDQQQASSFTKSDGYTWRYITSITSASYNSFSTTQCVPVTPNTTIQSGASAYRGVEVIPVVSGGNGYSTYNSGTILSNPDQYTIQISTSANTSQDFYSKSSVYIYNIASSTSQLIRISRYFSNSSGNWAILSSPANTNNIEPSITQYIISPTVNISTNGNIPPKAYSVVNTSSNSIQSIVIIDPGSGVTWANANIVANNTFGSGANLYCIVPPPGGHGSNPASELYCQGLGLSITISNNESNTISTNLSYNRIGLLKNPYYSANGVKSTTPFTSNTFSSLLYCNTSGGIAYTVGDTVIGSVSNSSGIVVSSNSSVLTLTGDQAFVNAEYITSVSTSISSQININKFSDIYTGDIRPLYVQNISDVTRSNTQSESFKLVIQI